MRSTRYLLLALAAVLLLPTAAPAQDAWSSRPLRTVAPFPPGGTTDVLARIMAQRLSDGLGGQVLVVHPSIPVRAVQQMVAHWIQQAPRG